MLSQRCLRLARPGSTQMLHRGSLCHEGSAHMAHTRHGRRLNGSENEISMALSNTSIRINATTSTSTSLIKLLIYIVFI